jgi:hypothetical protein
MKCDFYFSAAQRRFEEPEDFYEPEEERAVPFGVCPYCKKDLNWTDENEAFPWCETPGCKYDNGLMEDKNRELAGVVE